MENTFISVIIPVYNEEKYIDNCIKSLIEQDYPKRYMEWIFVDGMSTDKTKTIIEAYARENSIINLLNNPFKTVPYAMNIGIKAANGDYIIRIDAHADYPSDYFTKCVYYLNVTDADNVGGVATTKSNGFIGNLIAKMLSSKFGVGNSQFRTNGKSGYVDTVPFGAYRKSVFEKLGGYDERLTRNQDNEMNFRIRKNGGKIYLASDIHLSYFCRGSMRSICDMALNNGTWNIITMKLCPGSMGIRHFVPLVFVLSIIGLLILGIMERGFKYLLALELSLYLLLDMVFSAKTGDRMKECLLLIILFPLFHMTYGIGSLRGIARLFRKEFR